MAVKMAKNIVEERLRWVSPIFNKEVRLVDVVKVCPHSQRSLERWLADYRKYGLTGLEAKSTRPRSNPNETPIWVKEKIIDLRNENRKCALKLKWDLEKEDIHIHERTIGKIIKTEGLTRRYRIRKIEYKYVKALLRQGELVEIDVKYVPKKLDNKRYFQYTAIDVASRWRYLIICEEQSNFNAIDFLKTVIDIFPYPILAIKTDNHSTFTNRYTGYQKSRDPFNPRLHPLDIFCLEKGIEHYLIDPGKPQQNGHVERSHRSDQESFYDQVEFKTEEELKYKIRLWNMYYNDLEHIGLNGKTPNEMLKYLNP